MKLNVENFGKIKSASIELNGLTIIAGLNNTGKSTIGKILFGIFNSVKNIDNAVVEAKRRAFRKAVRNVLSHNMNRVFRLKSDPYFPIYLDKLYSIEENKINIDELFNYLESKQDAFKFTLNDDLRLQIKESVDAILSISNEQFIKSVVTEKFSDIFNGQINDIRDSVIDAEIQLTIKQRKLGLTFKNDELRAIIKEISLVNSATYIENPTVIDGLNDTFYDSFILNDLRGKLEKPSYEDEDEEEEKINGRVEDRVLLKQLVLNKIKKISAELDDVIPGTILNADGDYVYNEKNEKSLNINSLSTGLKAFALIKLLLLNQRLRERDVLILDEPEVHLHPAWQLKYAEIIVLLQKIFDLTVVVTTHSSHFMEAIDLYSKIHETSGNCTYYLASLNEENRSEFQNVSHQMDKIYRSLVEPNFLIDKIKEEKGIE